MSTTEILLLLQTLILFGTGVVIAWYTWEASQLRKIANAQLRITRRMLTNDIVRDARTWEPIFEWAVEERTPSKCVWQFENTGHSVSRLIALTKWEGVRIQIKPDHALPAGGEGVLAIEGHLPQALEFSINFVAKTGHSGALAFRVVQGEKPIQIESATYI